MVTHIDGIRYKYKVVSRTKKEESYFLIEAIHCKTRRTSTISTLNPILSEFNLDVNDGKCKESVWLIEKTELNFLKETAIKFLSDRQFQKYLEKVLDEDRKQSEWENFDTHYN